MATKFDLNDDGLFVIVGSGAGGGTLGAELARKGIKTVMLEAGGVVYVDEAGALQPKGAGCRGCGKFA